jgi:hypothetical protein
MGGGFLFCKPFDDRQADRYRVLYIDHNRAEMPFKTASVPVVADPNCVLVTLKATGEIKSLPKQNAAYLIQRGLALEVKWLTDFIDIAQAVAE